ncbi:hypothetical protein FRZ06_09890 [Anoxybacterium hadale]|uniref:Uncharacterized protein n=1 Tax=Anoxybacterium hadale TaxID=3408580 RepID=A0ACD1AB33_9FIRM|nr:hypothetical protein FRZ06_09890 [Clostridiales bacterium]
METVFLQIFSMSITASYVILFVVLIRLPMKKAPRIFSYLLWTAVLFRLISPIAIENSFSLIPSAENLMPVIREELTGEQIVPAENQRAVWETGDEGISVEAGSQSTNITGGLERSWTDNENDIYFNQVKNPITYEKIFITDGLLALSTVLWLAGMSLLLLYSICSTIRLTKKLKTAINIENNVYELPEIGTPFVFGLFRPKIYLPSGIEGMERTFILNHEKTHIRRLDYVIKPVAFAILCLHWFNPLVWIAYHLMTEDMECSCDESVLQRMGSEIKKDYSRTLLALSGGRRLAGEGPLAFGEDHVKGRIRNILNYKKPKMTLVVVVVLVVAVVSIGLMSNPKSGMLTVEDFAQQFVDDQIAAYNQSDFTGFRIIDNKITVFEKLDEFDFMLDVPVEVWRIEYRLKPDDPSKVMLAGGMGMIDGWLTEESSMGKPLLLFAREKEGPRFLGSVNTGDSMNGSIDTRAGRETMLRVFLENQNLLAHETYDGEHILMKFPLSTGETCQLLLSRPVKKDDSGIWCVERWMDGNGTVYYDTPETSGTALEYYTQMQEQVAAGQELWRLDPIAVSLDYINHVLGQHVAEDELKPQYDAVPADFERTPESHYIGYISNWKTYSDKQGMFSFYLDAVEWLTLEDGKRLESLNISPDELPNGFYIYNPNTYPDFYQGTEQTIFRISDRKTGVGYEEISMEEFQAYLQRYSEKELASAPLYRIITKDGFVQSIEEQYLSLTI